MYGIILASIATLISEVGDTIGKNEVAKRRESILGMGFLNSLWGTIILIGIIVLIPNESYLGSQFGQVRFSTDVLPLSLFTLRLVLEIILINLVLRGVTVTTRSTFSFMRMLTIPLLLLVDIYLGYDISFWEIIGISVILLTTILLISTHTLKTKGIWYILTSSTIAVVTVSLYKYNITHFNTVAGEQLVMSSIIVVYLFVATFYSTKRNPIRHLKRPAVIIQSFTIGLGSVITSFAFLFAPSSVIMTARRTSAVFWAIISGSFYFHEKKVGAKMIGLSVLGLGLFLLTNPF